jgi:hypothetical protein
MLMIMAVVIFCCIHVSSENMQIKVWGFINMLILYRISVCYAINFSSSEFLSSSYKEEVIYDQ